jgi:hypothetical protein
MIEHLLSPYQKNFTWNNKSTIGWATEQINGNDCLLITIGESWTWGDSLGNSDAGGGKDDKEFRLSNVFGGQLAKKINADWVNIAGPGASNEWIISQFERLSEMNKFNDSFKDYKKIYIVLTLTELCREAIPIVDLTKINVVNDPLTQIERQQFIKINDIISSLNNKFKILIGRNFTDSFKENISILTPNYLNTSWCDLIQMQINYSPYNNNVRIMSYGFDKIIKWGEQNKFINPIYKTSLLELLIAGNDRIDFLHNSRYNNKKATKHPTPEGHALWANYLYDNLKEK